VRILLLLAAAVFAQPPCGVGADAAVERAVAAGEQVEKPAAAARNRVCRVHAFLSGCLKPCRAGKNGRFLL